MSENGSNKSTDGIFVALQDAAALVRVRGRASFKVSSALKSFCNEAVNNGAQKIILDMRDCIGMDSTFMGVLAGITVRLHETHKGTVHLINLTPRTRGLLSTLGLDQLVEAYMTGASPDSLAGYFEEEHLLDELDTKQADRNETAQTMLEAHETLVEVFPENQPKFKDVLIYLREDVNKSGRQQPQEPDQQK